MNVLCRRQLNVIAIQIIAILQNKDLLCGKVEKDLFLKTRFLGPPLRTIYDELSAPTQEKQAKMDDDYLDSSLNIPSVMNSSKNLTALSSTSNTINLNNATNERDYWITVFGFPNEQHNNILELFSKHGDIVTHKVNFLNIKL